MARASSKRSTKAPFPGYIAPALASLERSPPLGSAWVHELKFDGYRLQAHVQAGEAKLLTRRGLDWTTRFGGLAGAVRALPVESAIIDGEVVIEDERGLSSFSALQEALGAGRGNFVLYAFDLLYLDGRDLRELPLIERKAALAGIIAAPGRVRYSEHFDDGPALFRIACEIGAEGIISKRRDMRYVPGRSKCWLKVKCAWRQEFVVAGYVRSKASARAIGSLVLSYYEDCKLIYAGRVGTGFSDNLAHELWERLEAMRTPASPFAKRLPRADTRGVCFVRPEIVIEVQFRGWTGDRLVRHASFRGLREDKRAEEVALEAT